MLGRDPVDQARFHEPSSRAPRFRGGLPPGGDLLVGVEHFAGAEHVRWAELVDRTDVAAGDPATDGGLGDTQQLGNIAGRDLWLAVGLVEVVVARCPPPQPVGTWAW